MRAESVDFDTTQNLIIEGDNLEVLKLLQKSYYGKVKMIYIDPPYNTGNDFIYLDNFSEGLQDYLRYSGQVDGNGLRMSTNTESEGRYHSNWLNMMYPRLFLARNLLRDDGVIFVSIDDAEVHNLRALLNDLFGEENFIATLIHQRAKGGGQAKQVVNGHDFIQVFAKSAASASPLRRRKVIQGKIEQIDGKEYLIDDDIVRKQFGKYDKSLGDRRCFYEELEIYKGPEKKREIDAKIASGELFLRKWSNGLHVIAKKTLLEDSSSKLYSIIRVLSEEGKRDLEQLVEAVANREDESLVLDFFAGSGTTAHAVMKLNAEDGGNRRFILVQLPEPTEGEYPTISAIARERVRRAGKAKATERAGKLDLDGNGRIDLGFRAYKLTTSNFTPWDGDPARFGASVKQPGLFPTTIAEQLELAVDNLLPGRTSEAILAELLLKSGFELTAPVECLTLAGKEVFSVAEGALLVCLERDLTLEVIEAMVARDPAQIICLDAGFHGNDQLKVNAVQTIRTRARSGDAKIEFKVV